MRDTVIRQLLKELDNTKIEVNDSTADSVDSTYSASKIEEIIANTVTIVTDRYSILSSDYTIICNSTASFTVTLPTATVMSIFNIKNINTGIITLEGKDSDTIDGELNQTIYQWDSITVQCYEANKWVII